MGAVISRRSLSTEELERLAPIGLSESTLGLVSELTGRSYEYGLARQRRPSNGVVCRLTRLRHELREHRSRIDRAPQLNAVLEDANLDRVDRRVVVGLQLVQTARADLAKDTVELRRRIAELAHDLEGEGFSPTDFGLPLLARARRLLADSQENLGHEVGLLRRLKRAADRFRP